MRWICSVFICNFSYESNSSLISYVSDDHQRRMSTESRAKVVDPYPANAWCLSTRDASSSLPSPRHSPSCYFSSRIAMKHRFLHVLCPLFRLYSSVCTNWRRQRRARSHSLDNLTVVEHYRNLVSLVEWHRYDQRSLLLIEHSCCCDTPSIWSLHRRRWPWTSRSIVWNSTSTRLHITLLLPFRWTRFLSDGRDEFLLAHWNGAKGVDTYSKNNTVHQRQVSGHPYHCSCLCQADCELDELDIEKHRSMQSSSCWHESYPCNCSNSVAVTLLEGFCFTTTWGFLSHERNRRVICNRKKNRCFIVII